MPQVDMPEALPHSDEAERGVLAGILLDNAQGPAVFEVLRSAEFSSDRGARIGGKA